MKNVLFAAIVLLAIGTSTEAQSNRFDFDSQLGIADALNKKPCLAIPNATIPEGTQITLVSAYKPQLVTKAVVLRRLGTSCSRDANVSSDLSFYSLRPLKADPRFYDYYGVGTPSVAIVGRTRRILMSGGIASVDLDGDGRREYFRECTSTEGVHLTVWSGRPLKGKKKQHWYYYLQYGVRPTCKKRDFSD